MSRSRSRSRDTRGGNDKEEEPKCTCVCTCKKPEPPIKLTLYEEQLLQLHDSGEPNQSLPPRVPRDPRRQSFAIERDSTNDESSLDAFSGFDDDSFVSRELNSDEAFDLSYVSVGNQSAGRRSRARSRSKTRTPPQQSQANNVRRALFQDESGDDRHVTFEDARNSNFYMADESLLEVEDDPSNVPLLGYNYRVSSFR